jgi:Tol biopolymer transport system component
MRSICLVSVILATACNSSHSGGGAGGGNTPDASSDASAGDAASGADASTSTEIGRTTIVFAAALDGQSGFDLYATDGTTTTRLTTTDGWDLYPSISPDRTQIAFVRDFKLYVVDATGANERLIAPVTGRERKINDNVYSTTLGPAAWSPDGKLLAYLYPLEPKVIDMDGDLVDESYATTVHVVGADGTNDHAITTMAMRTTNSLAWSADTLSFSQADDCPDCAGGQYYAVMRTNGSGYREFIYFTAAGDASPNKHLDWSPDGSRWAFVVGGGYSSYDEPGSIFTSSATVDNEAMLVPFPARNPRWSADGAQLAYIGSDGIYVIEASGGGNRRVIAASSIRGIDW